MTKSNMNNVNNRPIHCEKSPKSTEKCEPSHSGSSKQMSSSGSHHCASKLSYSDENSERSPSGIPKQMPSNEISDKGPFIIAKARTSNGVEFYSISDLERTRTVLSKYRINTDGMNAHTLKLFPHKDRIYVCYLTRNLRLEVKSWSFKGQTMTDMLVPSTIQYLKPRLISAVGDDILVSDEKYVTWPYESYKTTACKFGLESESYRCVEFNYDSLKEIICMGDDIFVFSNQKPEVVSFDFNTNKRTSRGILNNNGTIKAIIYHGNLYVGSYVRSQCTLFVEHFDKINNQWTVVSSFSL